MLDPFVPVYVDKFNDAELNNFINYYAEKKWLQHPEATSPDGRQELKYMSCNNGFELMDMINAH